MSEIVGALRRDPGSLSVAIVALVIGAAIGYVDSRPTWDDTGITVMTLLLAAAGCGFARPRQWWLWGVLLGIGIPAFNLASGGSPTSTIAIAFALLGAAIGALMRLGARSAAR